MSIKSDILNMDETIFKKLVSECKTKKELHLILGAPINGKYIKLINDKINNTGAIFKEKQLKYKPVSKTCPVCGLSFTTLKDHPREKTTCSYSCSNTHFRSGMNNGAHIKSPNYRTVCFLHHKKECCVCGENRIVEVHHFDNDHSNNNKNNLIPLCPTCHKLYHSSYRSDVEQQIITFHMY